MTRGVVLSKIYQLQQIKFQHQKIRYREQNEAGFASGGDTGSQQICPFYPFVRGLKNLIATK